MSAPLPDCGILLDTDTVCGGAPFADIVLFDKALGLRAEVPVCREHSAEFDRKSAEMRTRTRKSAASRR
jgi:hypothetical protein